MDFQDGTYEIIGSAMRVHRFLGPGLREKPYKNALVIDLQNIGIKVQQQRAYPISYLNSIVGDCIPDMTVNDSVLVDAKSVDAIGENEIAQMLNYLRIARLEVGLIINFKNPKLEWVRKVKSQNE